MKAFFLGSLGLLAAVSAFADGAPLKPFSYRVVVATDSAECGARTSAVADRFARATGLQVTDVSCTADQPLVEGPQTYARTVVIVSYLAAAKPQTYSAVIGGRDFEGVAEASAGIFASYGDCLKVLDAQLPLYEHHTQLVAVAGHCDASDDAVKSGYSLTIEGFGTPMHRLWTVSDSTDASWGYVAPAVEQALQNAVSAGGGEIVYTNDSAVFYYAPYTVDVRTMDLGLMNSTDECTAQVGEAQAILDAAGGKGASAFCIGLSDHDTSTAQLTAVGADLLSVTSDYGYNSAKYSSFAECLGDKARVLQDVNSGSSRAALGAICKPTGTTNSQYAIEIYNNGY